MGGYISNSRYSGILSAGHEMCECVSLVRAATPTYAKGQRATVISRNLRLVRHPYYTEYTYLQKICLKILRREKIAYRSQARSEINGVVFAVDWLWEEYLARLLQGTAWNGYLSHPRNKDSRSGEKIHLFAPHGGVAYPDFMLRKNRQESPQDEFAILDAKYQRLSSEDGRHTCVPRMDRLQMIKLGVAAPTNVLAHGKLFKEWIGMMLTGAMDDGVGLEISVRKAFGWRSYK